MRHAAFKGHSKVMLAKHLFHPDLNDLPAFTVRKCPDMEVWAQYGTGSEELWFRAVCSPAPKEGFFAVKYLDGSGDQDDKVPLSRIKPFPIEGEVGRTHNEPHRMRAAL